MKNNFLRETLIFSFALSAMFLFLSSSKSSVNPNTRITITINDEKVEISVDADVIVLDVDNEYFDSFPVKQIFDKWELDYDEEFDTAVIADSEF